MWRNVVIVIQRLMVRTQGGPLRPVWAALYTAVMHLVAAYLCYGHKGAAVYVCRSLAIDEPIYGVSDIDLVVVIPGAKDRNGTESERHRSRWRHLCRLVPPLRDLLPDVAFYEEAELREATRGPVLTYGLDRGVQGHTDRAAFWGPGAPADEFGLRSRPGLYGPTSDWRPIRGPDRRPRVDAPDRQERRIAGWLELQFWWSFAFGLAADPERPRSASLCVKLIAEPARIWLSLVDEAVIHRRRDVLRRALVRLPDEENAIGRALELHDNLGCCPSAPLADLLPAFVRLTSRVARRLREEVNGAGETAVRLTAREEMHLVLPPTVVGRGATSGGDHHERQSPLPLVDWRALTIPSLPDEAWRPVSGNLSDPDDLGQAAKLGRGGPYPLLRGDGIMVLPALGVWDRAFLRAVECQPTDPVSFALLEGSSTARFPNVRGWSAEDWARRAVAEHRAWLTEGPGMYPGRRDWPEVEAVAPSLRAIARLFTAARAALFLESIEREEPELRLTVAAVADRLYESWDAGTVAESALNAYRTGLADERPPPAETVAALRKLVLALPAYAPTR